MDFDLLQNTLTQHKEGLARLREGKVYAMPCHGCMEYVLFLACSPFNRPSAARPPFRGAD
jgi:hypothetical protein